ncbi:MAG: site-specific DNA-methyltransferase [Magnetospirillum sp.]|nr:site-specific DNA-methyltransferase [Magnetospirillum sp.]
MEALKALLPEFENRIDCIYIDPPYNTGNENWVYNDAVNDPRILRWLNKVVGKEGEDFSRHDKWLCMMYPRLKLLWRLLSEKGSLWFSIDDAEMPCARLLMDEIAGQQSFVAANVWQKRYSRENRGAIGDAHEYVLVYAKTPKSFKHRRNLIPLDEKQARVYRNPENRKETDPSKRWRALPMTAQGYRPNQMYEIIGPNGTVHLPPDGRCWSMIELEFLKLKAAGRIYWGKDGNAQPSVIRYLSEVNGLVPWTWWPHEDVGHTDEAKKEINSILGSGNAFDTPKGTRLIQRILDIATDENSIVLDLFAGSGTTAHAVLRKNAEDNGTRRFILVEMMDYAETITAERVRRVMDGYGEGDKRVAGLGGSFIFHAVGQHALFDDDGHLNPAVDVNTMRRYLAYTEGLPAEAVVASDNPIAPAYVGSHDGRALLFHYQPHVGTTLDYEFLAGLRFDAATRPERLVVYADYCTLGEDFLARARIVFKKIPRDLTRL